jgi:hypothetical protein
MIFFMIKKMVLNSDKTFLYQVSENVGTVSRHIGESVTWKFAWMSWQRSIRRKCHKNERQSFRAATCSWAIRSLSFVISPPLPGFGRPAATCAHRNFFNSTGPGSGTAVSSAGADHTCIC